MLHKLNTIHYLGHLKCAYKNLINKEVQNKQLCLKTKSIYENFIKSDQLHHG